MELQLSGSNRGPSNGRFSTISVNNNNGVVKMYTQTGTSSIYCHLGTLANHHIEWSRNGPVFYGKGDYPKIAMNDNNLIVVVHEGYFRSVYYCVGVLNGEEIDWGTPYYICSGRYPTVALRNDRTVVIAYENAYLFYGTNYFIGEVSADRKTIENRSQNSTMFSHSVNELSLAINENNCIVAAGRTWNFKLIFKVGIFQDDNNVVPLSWGEEHACTSFKGYCPTIGMNNNGQIVSMQQSVFGRYLTYRLGQVQFDNKMIQWSVDPAKHYDLGCNATIALKDDGTVVEEHETNFSMLGIIGNRLFYHVGMIRN